MREILYTIKEWIIHKFSVHCEECNICQNCEYLKLELSRQQIINQQLVAKIVSLNKPVPDVESPFNPKDWEPINKRHIPFRVKRQQLEREDREKLKTVKVDAKTTTEELEKELNISSDNEQKEKDYAH